MFPKLWLTITVTISWFSSLANILLLMIVITSALPSIADESAGNQPNNKKPLRIAIESNYSPFSVLTPDGEPAGLLVEMWRAWSETTKTPVEFIPMGWSQTLIDLKNGKVDIHAGLFKSESRAQWIDFSNPIQQVSSALFIRAGSGLSHELADLQGVVLGLPKDTFQEKWLRTTHPNIPIKTYATNEELVRAVFHGEVAAILSEVPGINTELDRIGLRGLLSRSPQPVLRNTMYAGVRKGRDSLIELINEGFSHIPLERLVEIEKRWLPDIHDRFFEELLYKTNLTAAEEEWIRQNPAVSVAVTDFISPVDIVDDHGGYSGLNADLLALLSKRLGIKFVPVYFQKWDEVVQAAMEGLVDCALSMSKTAVRAQSLLFTEPYAFDPIVAVVKTGSTRISKWSDLKGKHVSVIKGLAVMDELRKQVSSEGLITVLENEADALRFLSTGETDVHVTTLVMYGNEQKRRPVSGLSIGVEKKTEGGAMRIAVQKGKPVLASVLAKGLKLITHDELRDLRNRWLGSFKEENNLVKVLTPKERAWLANHPHIRIGAMEAWPPMNFLDDFGKPSGFGADFISLLNQKLDGALQIISGQFRDNLDRVKAHDLDAIMDVTPKPDRAEFLNFTRTYLSIPHVIVARQDGPYYDSETALAGKTLALERGFGNVKYFQSKFPDITIKEFASTSLCLGAVAKGEADAYAGNRAVAMYLMEEELIANLQVHGRLNKPGSILTIGIRKDWPELASILEKLIAAIPKDKIREIRRKWAGLAETNDQENKIQLSPREYDWLAAHPTVSVASTPDWPPFEFIDEQGNYTGITADVFQLAAKRTGLKANYVIKPWSDMLEMLRKKELDLAPGLIKTPNREKFLAFTKPFITSYDAIWTHKDRYDISATDDFSGKTIAVEKGYYTQENLEKHHPDAKLLLVDNTLDALKAVVSKKADAYMGTLAVGNYLIERYLLTGLKLVGYNDETALELYIGVRDDQPILRDILQKGLDTITEEELATIKQRYLVPSAEQIKKLLLSKAEVTWLKEHQDMRIGVDPAWMPYESLSAEGVYEGVLSQYVTLLNHKLDIAMKPVPNLTRRDALQWINAKKLDVIPGITRTPEHEKALNFTAPYLSIPMVLVTSQDAAFIGGLDDLKNRRVAVLNGHVSQYYLKHDYPNIIVSSFTNLLDCLEAVKNGEVDAVFDTLPSITYAIRSQNVSGLKVAATTPYSFELAFGVRKDWPELIPILDHALDTISKDQRQFFFNRWVNVRYERGVDWQLVWEIVLVIAVFAGGILVAVFIWNRRLAREVEERRRTEQKLSEAEEKSRAMSEAVHDALIMIDSKSNVLFWNKAAELMFGISAAEALGKNMHSLFVSEDDQSKAMHGLKHFAKTGDGPVVDVMAEYTALDARGRTFPVEVAVSSFQIDNDWYAVGSVRDITERKMAEEKLRSNYEDLERFSRLVVGRETRMIKLKEEINDLLSKQGLEARYKIVQ